MPTKAKTPPDTSPDEVLKVEFLKNRSRAGSVAAIRLGQHDFVTRTDHGAWRQAIVEDVSD